MDRRAYVAYFDPDCEVLAVYRNQELMHYGPLGESPEFLLRELDAKVIYDTTDFLVGNSAFDVANGLAEPAQGLEEIEAWVSEKGQRLRRADEMEARANDLIEEAKRLRGWNDD